jgi:hypothetical protein
MQQEGFLSIQGAAERLAELARALSVEDLRGLIDSGQLPCAVYWLTRYCWLYVDPMGAAHHEKHGWPEWAARSPEDASPSQDSASPPLIYFIDEADHPNLNDRLGRPRPGGSGGLNLANFRPGLFIPVAAVEALAADNGYGAVQPLLEPWLLCPEPKKLPGYRQAIYEYLATAKKLGRPKPSPAEVLLDWRDDPPSGFGIEVEPKLRGFTYHSTGAQPIKFVSARSLGRAINGLIKSPKEAQHKSH